MSIVIEEQLREKLHWTERQRDTLLVYLEELIGIVEVVIGPDQTHELFKAVAKARTLLSAVKTQR